MVQLSRPNSGDGSDIPPLTIQKTTAATSLIRPTLRQILIVLLLLITLFTILSAYMSWCSTGNTSSAGLIAAAAYSEGLPILHEENKLATGTRGGSSLPLLHHYPIIIPESCDSTSRGHFDEIYSKGLWGSKLRDVSALYSEAAWPPNNTTKESASGHGSDLGYATQTSLRIIKDTIGKHSVKSMIDIPCGDANWMFDSYVTDSLPFYLGLDVANATIELNRMRFAHHKNKMFTFWDATACVLPRYKHERSWPHPTWPSLQSPASSRQ
eukprot:scaffold25542_cov60-Cyclotella_meneghiniana.AAC.1